MRFLGRLAVLGLLYLGGRGMMQPEASARSSTPAPTLNKQGDLEEMRALLGEIDDVPMPVFKGRPVKLQPGFLFNAETGEMERATIAQTKRGKGIIISETKGI